MDFLALLDSAPLVQIINAAEELEALLQHSVYNPSHPTQNIPPSDVYLPLLTAYLITNDLSSARHLIKRAPNSLTTEFSLIAGIAKSIFEGDMVASYEVIRKGTDGNGTWSPSVRRLMGELEQTLQNRNFTLISRAYSSIDLGQAAKRMGLVNDEAISTLTARGWTYDASTQTFTPCPIVQPPDLSTDLTQFTQLVDTVVYLER